MSNWVFRLFLIIVLGVVVTVEAQSSALAVADSLYNLGDYSNAIKKYEQIIPADQYTLLQIARSHKAKGTYNNALIYYDKAIAEYPAFASTQLEYAKLLTTTRKFNKADSVYSILVSKQPENPNFQYRLGLVKKNLQDSTAIAYFKQASELDSTHQKSRSEIAKYYLKKRKYDDVEDIANMGLRSYEENAELINILGQNYLLREYYSKAIPYFEKLLRLNHKNEYIYASLGLCYTKNYDFKKAVIHYKKALEYNDEIYIRHIRLAENYAKLEKYDKALESYKAAKALREFPIEEDLLNIAMTYRHQEQWENAIKYAKMALKENPNYIKAQYQLATFADAYYKDPQIKLDYYNLFKKKFEDHKDSKGFLNMLVNKRIGQLEQEIANSTKDN